jgi:hypothetical protein
MVSYGLTLNYQNLVEKACQDKLTTLFGLFISDEKSFIK